MTRYKIFGSVTAAALMLSTVPASAQDRPRENGGAVERQGGPAGGRDSGGSDRGGDRAVERSAPAPSSGGFGGSSASPSSPSAGVDRAPGRPSDAPSRRAAPPERRGGGDRAVSRGGRESAGDSSTGRVSPDSSSSRGERATPGQDDAVPAYSRPREGRPATGTAVERRAPFGGGRNDAVFYPYYSNYYSRYYWPGYAFGMGFYSYDPFWFDPYYDPYSAGGYGGYSGGYGGGGGYSYQGSGYRDAGSLRLKIKPRDAKVYVDGYFAGVVDSFDGVFQKLGLDAGGHRVEVRAEGYEPIAFDVLITPGENVTYKGELKRIQ